MWSEHSAKAQGLLMAVILAGSLLFTACPHLIASVKNMMGKNIEHGC
jgi:hypothetical protein